MAKHYQKGSIMDFAVQGFSVIKQLSESGLISEKLIGLNSLMFVLIMAIDMTFWLDSSDKFNIASFIIFLLGLAFSLGISLLYTPFLSMIANFSLNKVDSLRVALIVMSLNLPISVAGLLYRNEMIIKISLGIIGLQLILVLLGSIFKYSKESSSDVSVNAGELWKVINNVAAICSILGFILSIALIIFK